ncbi:ImmA/IrrE family metallo-endopeptidase [Bacillaceae bacterium SIJ1]|uniref:ImmA/IrrE family metallo-endopeptidase n=1 Tax=Litoribacterium kuwaitense TaxID=1398745 RepID=UPI0013EA0AED|nr:ImmA/IrrE family metallo-endopeptidase [Litoribacterium kuwaitense]NGP45734.1 ImmA/IrrE family metallo-endopeptidase [Litoribacterium kuwaitense]
MYYTTSHLEDFVKALYDEMNIKTPDQLDARMIAYILGLRLVFEPHDSAFYFNTIWIDSRLSEADRWEKLGHELGHALRHAGNQMVMPKSWVDYQELDANRFAFHFCVPTFMLREVRLPYSLDEAIAIVAKTFNVTPGFAAKRLAHYEQKLIADPANQQYFC